MPQICLAFLLANLQLGVEKSEIHAMKEMWDAVRACGRGEARTMNLVV